MAPRRSKAPGFIALALLVALIGAIGFVAYLDHRVRSEFEGRRFALPARLYARPLELHSGAKLRQAALESELRLLGYSESRTRDGESRSRDGESRTRDGESRGRRAEGGSGWFTRSPGAVEIAMRPFVFWDGSQPAQRVRVTFEDGRIAALEDARGQPLPLARLEPMAIGGIYPANNEDRLLVRLDEVPKHFVHTLLAVEDRRFYSHHGFDLRGMARAAASLVTRDRPQGGSTITQQLVKNFFLSPERTVTRKVTELVMAVLLELHYGKDEILETYLNEIYLGQDRDRAIHGVGLAAQFWFGRPIHELSVAQSALLVGMIRGPGLYDPRRNPQRALERRNLALKESNEIGALTLAQLAAAQAQPLGVTPRNATGTSPYPAFLQLVQRQLKDDYADADLRSEGLRIFTTLDPLAQSAAESALTRRLEQYDKERRFGKPGVEGAIVVTSTQTGEVQAVVGGRDPRYRGYNRALDAQRPVGSLLKPAIYLTALSDPAHYTLASRIDDGPFTWKARGAKDWQPENYDGRFHGMVPITTALAHSYNAAAARLGTDLGVERVLANVKKLGVDRELPPYAASLLGAVDMSPYEVAQMYQTIASGGFRTRLTAIREVTTADGKPLKRYPMATEQAFEAEPMYLLTTAMQQVVREGTAAELRRWVAPEVGAAGKTGTTDAQRDAWFAGFTGDRLGIVWIGYDDNRAARLSGASAAVPVWGEAMAMLDPEPLAPLRPDGIEMVAIDPETGLRGGNLCSGAVELPFIRGSAPRELAPCGDPIEAIGEAVDRAVTKARGFFERLFGR